MTKTALAAIGLVVLLGVPASAAQGTTGPFTGTVREHQPRMHFYDNNPENLLCPQMQRTYTVTLTYTPTTDVLTLSVDDLTATGSNGQATLTFDRSFCTDFTIRVTGTSVASVADYTVTVSRDGGAVPI